MSKELMKNLKNLEELTVKKLRLIRELRASIQNEESIPTGAAQQKIDLTTDPVLIFKLKPDSSLKHHIYELLENYNNGNFTSKSLTSILRSNTNADYARKYTFNKLRGRVQRTLKEMRSTAYQVPSFHWSEKPRSGGGTMFIYWWGAANKR